MLWSVDIMPLPKMVYSVRKGAIAFWRSDGLAEEAGVPVAIGADHRITFGVFRFSFGDGCFAFGVWAIRYQGSIPVDGAMPVASRDCS
jgi:hypothetical protein